MSSSQDRANRKKERDEAKKHDKAWKKWHKLYAKGTYKGVPVGSLDSAPDAEASNSVGDSDPDMWSSGTPGGARAKKGWAY